MWVCHLAGEERAGCFAYVVFLLSCGCWCSVSLPHSALGWSASCHCDISRSYSLTFRHNRLTSFVLPF